MIMWKTLSTERRATIIEQFESHHEDLPSLATLWLRGWVTWEGNTARIETYSPVTSFGKVKNGERFLAIDRYGNLDNETIFIKDEVNRVIGGNHTNAILTNTDSRYHFMDGDKVIVMGAE